MGCSNPTQQVLNEAKFVFGADHQVDYILSLGAGQAEIISLGDTSNIAQNILPINVTKVLRGLATDCERMAYDLERCYQCTPGIYIRLDTEHGLQRVKLAE